MKHISRLFSGSAYRGTRNYIKIQSQYNAVRTILFFLISFAIFAIGLFSTGSRSNLLTVIAVLGLLPASKSLVESIMFFRYKSCEESLSEKLESQCDGFTHAFDLVFTTYQKNYPVDHLIVSNKSIIGYSSANDFDENACKSHLDTVLKADGHQGFVIKIFTDQKKYLSRINELQADSNEESINQSILHSLLNMCL